MFKLWGKKNSDDSAKQPDPSQEESSGALTWDAQAQQALNQSVAQAPVPKMMKNQVKKQLASAAEEQARAAGRTTVTAEDLMNGLMSKLPAHMKKQVEDAAKQGPQGLQNLQKKLKGK